MIARTAPRSGVPPPTNEEISLKISERKSPITVKSGSEEDAAPCVALGTTPPDVIGVGTDTTGVVVPGDVVPNWVPDEVPECAPDVPLGDDGGTECDVPGAGEVGGVTGVVGTAGVTGTGGDTGADGPDWGGKLLPPEELPPDDPPPEEGEHAFVVAEPAETVAVSMPAELRALTSNEYAVAHVSPVKSVEVDVIQPEFVPAVVFST